MKYWIAIGLVATLAACSGDNGASKSELSQAIESYNQEHPFCVPVKDVLGQQAGNTAHLIKGQLGDDWVHVTTENLDGDDINEAAQKQMRILTRAGLYEKAGNREQKAVLGANLEVAIDSYSLTKEGHAQFRKGDKGNHALCVGHIKVDKVLWFTEPTPANGMVMTQVRYQPEYKLENFAKKLLKEGMPNVQKNVQGEQALNATLVRTDSGWRDVRELSLTQK